MGVSYPSGGIMNYLKTMHSIVVQDCKEEADKEYVKYGIDTDQGFKGIKYTGFKLDAKGLKAFKDLIPEQYQDQFNMSLMSISSDILPHTDSNTKTVINLYIETGGYVTSYCKPKPNAKHFKLPTQTDGVAFSFDDVDLNESFIAKPGEVYVLRVDQLHCVHSGQGNRTALNYATSLPFEKVVEILS
jgi:hypothetical protein